MSKCKMRKLVKPRLDILKEGEEDLNSNPEKCESNDDANNNQTVNDESRDKPSFFGVRSYLHHFYEPVSNYEGSKSECSEDSGESRYLIAPKEKKRAPRIWSFAFGLGLTLLISGLITLTVAYAHARRQVIIGREEEMEIIDPVAIDFNRKLDWLKILGLLVFCVGSSMVAITLILPGLVGISCLDTSDDYDESTPFKVAVPDGETIPGDSECKVPATQKVTSVQPSRPEEESVVTESGLTKMK